MTKNLKFKLVYHKDVKKIDLPKIDEKMKLMIKKAFEERLATHPEVYGKPLRNTLKGYWKLRVRDYRIVFKIDGNVVCVLGIIHRRNVYKFAGKRKR